MNKHELMAILTSKNSAYPEFAAIAAAQTSSIKWAFGIAPPFSLEPYRVELLGIKPGKMLKTASSPGRNRHRYSFDSEGRVLHCVSYASRSGRPGQERWIHVDDFYDYAYAKDTIIRYVYGDVVDGGEDAALDRVVVVELKSGSVVRDWVLEGGELEYSKTEYLYVGGKVDEIRRTWPDAPERNSHFKLIHEKDGVRILERGARGETQIYPAE